MIDLLQKVNSFCGFNKVFLLLQITLLLLLIPELQLQLASAISKHADHTLC